MKRAVGAVGRGAALVSLLAGWAMAGNSGFHLLKTYKVGGDGGWDYLRLDSASRHLYISRSTHVTVIDADSGQAVGEIPDTAGVHGIALASELGRGFTSNGREGTVTVFDLNTLKPIAKVSVGKNPDAIVYTRSPNEYSPSTVEARIPPQSTPSKAL